jgi:predicted transcriptional regulator
MENVCRLFFELSNDDRLRIMLELEKEPLKLTHVSKKLDLTSSETHRQLSRLSETKLVVKDVEGFFSLTPFGEQALKWIPGYTFISDNREYFQSHTLSNLPHDLLSRLGDLASCMFSNDALVSVSHIETTIREADEYIQNIHDQYLASAYPLASEAVKRGVHVKSIDPVVYSPSLQIKGEISEEDHKTYSNALEDGRLVNRKMEHFDVFLWMSEKEVAILSFPTFDGKFDYLGFTSKDDRAHKWCNDLFRYYWERAEPKNELTLARPYKVQ